MRIIIHKNKILQKYPSLSAYAKAIKANRNVLQGLLENKTGRFANNSETWKLFKRMEKQGYAQKTEIED